MATGTAPPEPAYVARIDVVSDVVCPWCYIGKHRLEQGLAALETDVPVEVRWRPFELNPTLPADGMDRDAYCERKFGSVEYARRLYENVAANARADGLPIEVERIRRTPNTRAAHRLIAAAGDAHGQDALVDALFAAYFVDGLDVGDRDVLRKLARGVGLGDAAIAAALEGDADDGSIEAQEREAHEMGVSGVPAFVYNGRLLFSGAQDPVTVKLAIERAIAKRL